MDRNFLNLEEYSRASSLAANDSAPEVQSLEEALNDAFGWPRLARNPSAIADHGEPETEAKSSVEYPQNFASGAIPSTPKSLSLGSLRLSDSDSHITTEGSLGECRSSTQMASGHCERSELELVMPSLTLPHRRPFTERGKRMGPLTLCVAGRKGNS
jgi:hypothetical protein